MPETVRHARPLSSSLHIPPLQVVAFLDTGAGKTFVSALLIRHCLAQERAAAAAPSSAMAACRAAPAPAKPCAAEDACQLIGGRRVAVFLAPKVALVLQQAEVLRAHLGASHVAHFVGEMGVDLYERDRCGLCRGSHAPKQARRKHTNACRPAAQRPCAGRAALPVPAPRSWQAVNQPGCPTHVAGGTRPSGNTTLWP